MPESGRRDLHPYQTESSAWWLEVLCTGFHRDSHFNESHSVFRLAGVVDLVQLLASPSGAGHSCRVLSSQVAEKLSVLLIVYVLSTLAVAIAFRIWCIR